MIMAEIKPTAGEGAQKYTFAQILFSSQEDCIRSDETRVDR